MKLFFLSLICYYMMFLIFQGMVLGGKDGKSYLADGHFAQLEGIKEESTLLLRNFYKSEEIFLDVRII